jgi:hypothetical protein
MSSAGELTPGRLWSLWDIMKAFNAALLGHAFGQLTEYADHAAIKDDLDGKVSQDQLAHISLTLQVTKVIAISVQLDETKAAIRRLEAEMQYTGSPITNVKLRFSLQHLLELMKSELEKRKIFVLDPSKSNYYLDDIYGVKPPDQLSTNALMTLLEEPRPLFSERATKAFPSAFMDIAEAGRCLALNRNNAAIYHLMQVAEIGLRTLAWDRRIEVTRHKKQVFVPLEYALWGEMIGQIQKAKDKIHHWPRSKALKENAVRYYTRAVFEVDAFNEIFRKHISHARGERYESDVAISCWGHVYRFMDMLSERMSETSRTPNVWNSPKKMKSSVFD